MSDAEMLPDPLKDALREAWLETMRASRRDGASGLLPSEAARIVGAPLGLDPATVLIAIFPTGDARPKPTHMIKLDYHGDEPPAALEIGADDQRSVP